MTTSQQKIAQPLGEAYADERAVALADAILAEEVAMLERIMLALPALTDAVVDADVRGQGRYRVRSTGAAEAVRQAGDARLATAREAAGAYECKHKNRSGVLHAAGRQHSQV
jgi:hypothetical protein